MNLEHKCLVCKKENPVPFWIAGTYILCDDHKVSISKKELSSQDHNNLSDFEKSILIYSLRGQLDKSELSLDILKRMLAFEEMMHLETKKEGNDLQKICINLVEQFKKAFIGEPCRN